MKLKPRRPAAKTSPCPKTYRQELRWSEKRYRDLLGHLPVGVYRTTRAGRIVEANPALARILGYATAADLRNVDVKDLYVEAAEREAHFKKLEKRPVQFREFKLRRQDGTAIWGRDYPRAVKGKDGKIAFCDGILVDISGEKKGEGRLRAALKKLAQSQRDREAMIKKLEEASITDELTGLLNRRGFFTIGRQYISLAARRKVKMFLLFMDLDNLKSINDTFGHHMGDQALRLTADFLNRTFRESDIKGRMGGDEFAIFPIDSALNGVDAALARLQKVFDEFNSAPDRPFRLSISTGVSCLDPEHPASIEELLMRADKLMYESKRNKNGEKGGR